MFLRPREIHEAVIAAAGQPELAGLERPLRHPRWRRSHDPAGHRRHRIRTARYRGLPKTSLEHAAATTAINLIRLDALLMR